MMFLLHNIQEMGVFFLFSSHFIALFVLHIISIARRNLPVFSALFQTVIAGIACFVMLSFDGLDAMVIHIPLFQWLPGSSFTLYVDQISMILCLLVSCVSSCVQIYALGYLDYDEHRPRFFWQMSFFTAMMTMLALSGNLLMFFLAWEGIGVASFFLIGFYRTKEALDSSVVAFITNRIGDAALLLSLLSVLTTYHTLDYLTLLDQKAIFPNIALYGIFLAIVIKSAQWPWHFWLPFSMAAPTPVSALLHAATLVTAGVYLLIRIQPFIPPFFYGLECMQYVAAITIVCGGVNGICQSNIKKMIAYSTIAQLGYMVLAVSLGQTHLGLFHLWTHGFFKALLFMIAGIAIIRGHESQRLNDLKGVFSQESLLIVATLVALFSLMGLPGFAGFYSKERIIHWLIYHSFSYILPTCAILGAILTAIYCARIAAALFVKDVSEKTKQFQKSSSIMNMAVLIMMILTIWSGPLGELDFFSLLRDSHTTEWEFYKEAIRSGWVFVFAGVFFICYRMLYALDLNFPLKDSLKKVLAWIERDYGWPEFLIYYSYRLVHILASFFQSFQKLFLEKTICHVSSALALNMSKQVTMQYQGFVTHSMQQTLWIVIGSMILYTLQGG